MTGKLEGKTAVITGGASGIGEGVVQRFIEAGARCVIADLQLDLAESIAGKYSNAAIAVKADVAVEADVANAVKLAVDQFGGIDIMFNNAGILGAVGPITDIEGASWQRTIDVLLSSVFYGIKHAAIAMKKRGTGVIINTASTAGVRAGLGPHVYTAAKHGVVALTKSAATELGPHGIRCNVVCPGATVTALTARLATGDHTALEETHSRIGVDNPMGRTGQPSDIAGAVLYLASDDASFVNGAALVVDGGGEDIAGSSGTFVDMEAETVQEADRSGV